MPVASSSSVESGQEAMETIIDGLEVIRDSAEAKSMDLLFLKEMMEGRLMQNLMKAHDTLEDLNPVPCQEDSIGFAADTISELIPFVQDDDNAAELAGILQDLHMISLLQTHDKIASRTFEEPMVDLQENHIDADNPDNAVKLVGIRKPLNEPLYAPSLYPWERPVIIVGVSKKNNAPLGITVKSENGELVVARIIHGGVIDKQGLLHVGDIIKEINDQDITNDVDAFNYHLKNSNGRVSLKILPSYNESFKLLSPVYLRTFFDYNPEEDSLLPCENAGLSFKKGDILCVVDKEDPDWWQAYVVGKEGTSGLIPSQELEEKRRAFVPKEHIYTKHSYACGLIKTKRKKKTSYQTKDNHQFDRNDIIIYEEVQEMPPFQRKTLLLVGAPGVGRRVIVSQLIKTDRERFGCAVASTSRAPKAGEKDGRTYHFRSKKDMENDILNNNFLEYGEFMGNYYGTSFEAIREVNDDGKICILDVNPRSLKLLRNSEFLPYVVFIKSPDLDTLRAMHEDATKAKVPVYFRENLEKLAGLKVDKHILSHSLFQYELRESDRDADLQKAVKESQRIEHMYNHYFDFTIINNNLEDTVDIILQKLEEIETERQWVPVDWVYHAP